jgi:formate dehydrogenase major subunit
VADPRRIDLVDSRPYPGGASPAAAPGTNVAVVTALAHMSCHGRAVRRGVHPRALRLGRFQDYAEFRQRRAHSPEATELLTGVPAVELRAAARLFATGGNGAIYYGLGVTEHSQGSTTVIAIANLAMLTGNVGRPGVGVNPLRGQNNVQGSCDMGSFPHELPGYRHVKNDDARAIFETLWGVTARQ